MKQEITLMALIALLLIGEGLIDKFIP